MGLFEEQTSRKPNHYPKTQHFIDAFVHSTWNVSEFDFRADYGQFKSELTKEQQEIIVKTLSLIGQVEINVKTFWAKMPEVFRHPALSDLGYVMAYTEVIHNQAYEKLLEVLGLNDVFEENLKEDIIKGRVEYLRKYLDKVYKDDKKQYIYALILFTLFVENVSLFSQFYIILWFNRFQNKLKDTAQQVQYTRNEENLHAQIGIWLINTLREEYPEMFDEELEERIKEEVLLAYQYESAIIDWILGDYKEEGLDSDLLKDYIGHRISTSMKQIGFDFQYEAKRYDEFKWMDEELLGYNMTDFFAKKPVDYSKNNKSWNMEEVFND